MGKAAKEEYRLALADVEGEDGIDITQTAPIAAKVNATAMRGVVIWRSSSQPKPADITGVNVNTALVETGGLSFNPSNISTKYIANNPPIIR